VVFSNREDLILRLYVGRSRVTLFRQGAKSRTRGRKVRSTKTKAETRVDQVRKPRADLEQQLEKYRRELAEAREQQAATSEVLQVISSSPGELELVFQTILENAVRLCDAKFGILNLYDGEAFRNVAAHNVPPAYTEMRRRAPLLRPHPGTAHAEVARCLLALSTWAALARCSSYRCSRRTI
jgi:hypothetical protein